ncbi:MAG: 50S ribosomal protein L11 methyltransferase [Verrucomicrobiae bacterium]|nr:50S ribosomal protein L11 methyltransferase [Verrucomicrobiae bacterium]
MYRLRRGRVWELSVTVPSEAEDAVAELVARVYAMPPVVTTHLKSNASTITLYSHNRRLFSQARLRELQAGLEHIAACGLDVGVPRFDLRALRQKNWVEAWKKQFKPVRIGSAVLIKPGWSKAKPRKGKVVVVLDPGLAFGTGHHPTTAFCLEQIVRLRRASADQSLLDIGTGSGILAITAAKLGYAPVVAVDLDPSAVRVARANVKRNKLTRKVKVLKADVTKARLSSLGAFDVVCANLSTELLLSCVHQIGGAVSRGGALVLAGILSSEFEPVARAYRKAGFKLLTTRVQQEWQSGLFIAG